MAKPENTKSEYMREIEVNGSEGVGSSMYISNYIRSNRYTLLSLLPLNLFEQFHRYANIWFLIVVILQLSPLNTEPYERYTTLVPFVCILLFTLAKDAYQDICRVRADTVSNNRAYFVWDGVNYITELSKNLKVGQIVLVREGDFVPADMVLLAAADLDQKCYINASLILGESKLECKRAINDTQSMIEYSDASDVSAAIRRINGNLIIEQPNSNLFKFEGKFKIRGNPKAITLSIENLVLRSSYVAYTPWMLGVVVYTGSENKLHMNSLSIKKKSSRIETLVNRSVLIMIAVLAVLVIVSVLVNEFAYNNLDYTDKDSAGIAIVSNLLYFNQIIPISLLLTLDIAKALQSVYISRVMKNKVKFKTSDLNEDLGLVEYILADKSGTITNQNLRLRACSIANSIYWKQDTITDSELSNDDSNSYKLETNGRVPTLERPRSDAYDEDFLDFNQLRDELLSHGPDKELIYHMITCMAICNSVQPVLQGGFQYFATSNEEHLLVEEAREIGIALQSKSNNVCITKELAQEVEYEMLAYKPFKRDIGKSRMVVKKGAEEGAYFYIKGDAHDVQSICNLSIEEERKITGHMAMFSLRGLRTMAFAYRYLTGSELEEFTRRLEQARIAPVNNETRIEMVLFDFEKDFKFLGIAAFEEIVPEENKQTINMLQKAGIKIWMTSADSIKNCMAAARHSGLIPMDLPVAQLINVTSEFQAIQLMKKKFSKYVFHDNSGIISRGSSLIPTKKFNKPAIKSIEEPDFSAESNIMFKEIEQEISSLSNIDKIERTPKNRKQVRRSKSVHPFLRRFTQIEIKPDNILNKGLDPSAVKFAVLMDGASLDTFLVDENTKQLLITFLFTAQTAVFARLTPAQKVALVRILKQNLRFKPVVMAIGDSYCDLSMIQEADLGLAVKGLSQAENYSDIIVENFSMVYPLIVIHGTWNLYRLLKIVFLYFYKHLLYIALLFQTQFITAFSSFSFIDPKLAMFNHVVITGIPVLALGVFDENESQENLTKYAYTYIQRIIRQHTNCIKLLIVTSYAAIHSFLIFYLLGFIDVLNSDGFANSTSLTGMAYYITIVLTTLLQILLAAKSVNWVFIASLILAVILLILELIVVSEVKPNVTDYYSDPINILKSPVLLISILIIPLVCYATSYFYLAFKSIFHKKLSTVSMTDKIFEYPKKRLEQFKNNLQHLYKRNTVTNNHDQQDAYSINRYFLYFENKHVEINYKEDYYYENIKIIKIFLLSVWLLLLIWCILEIWVQDRGLGWIVASCIISIGFGGICLFVHTQQFKARYVSYLNIMLYAGILVNFLYHVTLYHNRGDGSGLEFNVCIAALTFIWFDVDFKMNCGVNAVNMIFAFLALFIKTDYSTDQAVESSIGFVWKISILISVTLISAIIGHQGDRSRREHFKLLRTTEIEIQKSKSIIGYLLPQFVIKRVRDGVRYIAEDQGNVSVLFCDIYDFDQICAEMQPIELTCFLDDLFKKFDQLCRSFGVTKIETVGKTYMACAGLRDSELDIDPVLRNIPHARRTLELGFAMVRYANGILLNSGQNLAVKVGINSGPVVAGVVGFHKPQFSLVGDTVNTASRMCSLSPQPNAVQISESTHSLVKDYEDYKFTEYSIEVKGKGSMIVYVAEENIIEEHYYDNSIDIPNTESQLLSVPYYQNFLITPASNTPIRPSTPVRSVNTPIRHKSSLNSSGESELVQSPETATVTARRRSNLFVSLEIDKTQDIFKRTDTNLLETTKLISLSCRETRLQKKFRLEYSEHNYRLIITSIIIAAVQVLLLMILKIIKYNLVEEYVNVEELVLRGIEIAWFIPIIYLYNREYKLYWFPWFIAVLYVYGSVIALLPGELSNTYDTSLENLEFMLFMLLNCYATGLFLKHVNLGLILQIIIWLIMQLVAKDTQEGLMTIYIIGYAALNSFSLYNRETVLRVYSNIKYIADKEIEKTDKLLIQMMPPHVYENLRDDKSITDKLPDVTLIYADIVGFTAWSSNKHPEEVVGMLSELFTRFDKMCVELNVYKVHTIGDCYVVMSYTGKAKRDITQECLKMVKMAESMIKIIEDINYENGSELNMRIGIHTGEVIAGIIGTNIIRYDIYGADALIANKMESSGSPGKINISDVTKTILEKYSKNDFVFLFNKEVELPTIHRTHNCYFLRSAGSYVEGEE